MLKKVVLGLVLALGVMGQATAGTIIYSTGFEAPTFTAGQPLVGQDGWVAPGFLSPNAATISTALPKSGLQGVQINGADLVSDPAVDPYDAVGSYRRPVNYDATNQITHIQADVRLDGPLTDQTRDRVTGDFFSANLFARSTDGRLGELSISSDGHIYGYANGVASDLSYLFGNTVTLGEYHLLAMDVNFFNRTTSYYLDGQLLGSTSFADPALGLTSNTFQRGAFVVYANKFDDNSPPGGRGAYTAYYDNLVISGTTVPEPGSMTLLGLGVAGMFGYRLRKSKSIR